MAQYPNNPDELERFRRATTLGGVGGAAPVTSVQPKTLPQPPTVRPKPAPRPGYSYQPGTPGYESLNIFQRAGLQPHFNVPKPAPARPAAAPMAAPAAAPAAAAKSPIQQLYEFLKGDLTRESEKARAAATVDASNRGVFYGQPLTAMGQDIDERYTRGLAQLQSSLIQNEQGNELERMRLALASLGPMQTPEVPAFPSDAFANLGAAFTQGNTAPVPNKPVTAVPPSYEKVGDKVKKKEKVD